MFTGCAEETVSNQSVARRSRSLGAMLHVSVRAEALVRKAAAFVLSAVTVLFLGSGAVVGCGSDDNGGADAGSSTNGDGGGLDSGAGADASSDAAAPSDAAPFGAFCDSDAECEDGLTCLTAEGSEWLGGGPAGGYCSLSCAQDPTICQQKYPNSMCITGSGGEKFCFEACQHGDSLFGGEKCHSRVNSACYYLSSTSAASACLPSCGYDDECPAGRYCDLALGVCVDEQPAGLPIGTKCDPDSAENPCTGFCIELRTGQGVCSGSCTYGAPGACGVPPDENPVGSGICLPLYDLANDGVGDTGLCVQRCNTADDCLSPGSICSEFNDTATEEAYQAKGLCVPGLAVGDGGTDSGSTPADAASDSGASAPDAADGG
jgi:hypothetical protein